MSMYSLPHPVIPFSDESLPGLVMRNAQLYKFAQPVRLFRRLKLQTLPLATICEQLPTGVTGRAVADLLQLDEQQLHRLSLWPASKTAVNVLGHGVQREMVTYRRRAVCPACLIESQHHRAIWLLDVLPICAVHGTWILHTCPGCQRPLPWYGVGVHRCRCGFDLRCAEPEDAVPGAGPGILGLDAVFHGQAEAPVNLEFGNLLTVVLRLGLHVLRWEGMINRSQRLGGFVQKRRTSLPEVLDAGWVALADWPASFHVSLTRIRSYCSPATSTGIKGSFGGFHTLLFHWSSMGWGKPLAEEFARFVAGCSDIVTTRHILSAYGSRKATKRADISMGEARVVLKVSAQTMQHIVARNPDMVLREPARRVSSLLRGTEIQRLKRSDSTLLTIVGVRKLLGLGQPVLMKLKAMGLIRTVPPTEYILESRAYRRAEVQALLDRCLAGAAGIRPEETVLRRTMNLQGVSRSWRPVYDIVAALSSGRLRAAGVVNGKCGFQSVLLDPSEVEAIMPHREAPIGPRELKTSLGVRLETLRLWRRSGFIRAVKGADYGRRVDFVFLPEAVRAFRDKYVSSADFVRTPGKKPSAGLATGRDLMTIGVQAVSGPGIDGAGTFLFQRSDLSNGELERALASRRKPELQTQRTIGVHRVDTALRRVMEEWGSEAPRKWNTLIFPGTGRVVHAVAGTRVSLVGRFTFHFTSKVYARLAASENAWLVLVPTEGEHFLLAPFREIVSSCHAGVPTGRSKWLNMRLHPVVDEQWKKYCVPLG